MDGPSLGDGSNQPHTTVSMALLLLRGRTTGQVSILSRRVRRIHFLTLPARSSILFSQPPLLALRRSSVENWTISGTVPTMTIPATARSAGSSGTQVVIVVNSLACSKTGTITQWHLPQYPFSAGWTDCLGPISFIVCGGKQLFTMVFLCQRYIPITEGSHMED